MLIQGSAISNRTNYLINEYISLLNNKVNADEILVIVQNPTKKNEFINSIKADINIKHFENPQIYTFYGLCYNTILNNWPIIENTINTGSPKITPRMTGLEISQFFLKKAIQEVGFNDYNSKINLIHQLFRRNSLIVNNSLTNKMVEFRSQLLKESFGDDAQNALDIFKKKTIEYRAFDYIRQVSIFNYIYQNTDYFKNIKYLIVDDADEITTAQFDFIKHIQKQLIKTYIGYDRHGSSRLGFLNTDVKTVEKIEKLFANNEKINLDDISIPKVEIELQSYPKRLEMLQNAISKIEDLINSGVQPNDISIITPTINSTLKFIIKEKFENSHIDFQFISGSEKLFSNPIVKNTITLLLLSLNEQQDIFDIRAILNEILDIPIKYCMKIVENYKQNGQIISCDLNNDTYNEKLIALIRTLDEISNSKLLLSEKTYIIYKNLIATKTPLKDSLEKFAFFLKQIQDFENVFEKHKELPSFQKAVLTQLKNSIIAENPIETADTNRNANTITIATAQKIIDISLQTKYQFWLDTSSNEWCKDDFGTLYNAWVFQNSWDKNQFTYEDNIELSELKIKKTLRKLKILSRKKIYAYSSLFDTRGCENLGGIEKYIHTEKNNPIQDFKFTPRNDQKPILEYKKGQMAISAVPGAGKTTILLALIIKLLTDGIKSENIFVLTYMDSAARNFKERIKKACPSIEKLPNISTIHGLALRILKENSNYTKIGLNDNFEVCDDNQRQKIIQELMYKQQIDAIEYFDKYERAISILKLSNTEITPYIVKKQNIEVKNFIKFFNQYNAYLQKLNLIDYDDMLSLCVQILEKNSDIAKYYQDLCQFIIEDEAQDSSAIQQKLISLLSKKHKNLIRCGDINQSITTTFTNADLDGFKDFIKNSKTVTMNCSQRCTKEIYQLANKLIKYAKNKKNFYNAFLDIEMNEVAGRNPISQNAITTEVFDDYKQENEFIIEKIRDIFNSEKNANIAILVRNNQQIEEYSEFLAQYGYNSITRTDTLNKQPVFNLSLAILNFCTYPWQNQYVLNVANTLTQQRHIYLSNEDLKFIENLKTPFILQNQDEIESKNLSQFLWDLNYWLENSTLNLEETTIKIGNYYYFSDVEKSNTYVTALLFKTVETQYKTRELAVNRLQEISNKQIGSNFNFFDEEHSENKKSNDIQIMTYHKSKGDEFDYVFIPNLNEENLQLNPENIKIKSKERFHESIKAINPKYKPKSELEQKLFQIEENLRLLYVAITRAKKKIFITSALKYKKYSRIKDAKQSIIFEELFELNKNPNIEHE